MPVIQTVSAANKHSNSRDKAWLLLQHIFVQNIENKNQSRKNLYYMNLQFTSTGAHLAPAEGPWKMEANYRYVNTRGPLTFSVVNAGNSDGFCCQ